MELRERFLKTYANIPLNLRDDIILMLDNKQKATGTTVKESITWRVAYIEINNDTDFGKKILADFAALDLI